MRLGVITVLCVLDAVTGVLAQSARLLSVSDTDEFSCAAFPRELDEAGLFVRYGRENVKSAPVVGSDDAPQAGTAVFPNQDDRRLEVVWWDPESRKRLHWVRTRGTGGWWQAPNGLRVGTDLKTIERRNGWPFRLRGFTGEGYAGRVVSWGKGRLTTADEGGCTVSVYFKPADDAAADPESTRQLTQGEFSSGHPAMQGLNPRVYQIIIAHAES